MTSFFLGVGKGNGTDMKVQIIMKKQVVLECVCATQGNCKVREYETVSESQKLDAGHKTK